MRRSATGVIAIAAVFAFATVIAPAIGGGPSLSKLSKQVKALQKQVASIQAQQGPPGPPGQQGAQGAQGPSALKVDYEGFALSQIDDIAVQDELTLRSYCDQPGGGGPAPQVLYAESSVPGRISWTASHEESDGGAATVDTGTLQLPTSTQTLVLFNNAPYPNPSHGRTEFQGVYRNDQRVISIQLHLRYDWGSQCRAEGTLVPTG